MLVLLLLVLVLVLLALVVVVVVVLLLLLLAPLVLAKAAKFSNSKRVLVALIAARWLLPIAPCTVKL